MYKVWRLEYATQPGDKAVPFSVDTIEGKRIDLEQFAGKPLLLMFYRYASCPCAIFACEISPSSIPGCTSVVSKLLLSFIHPGAIFVEMQETALPLSSGP